jgi:hypothetical protein
MVALFIGETICIHESADWNCMASVSICRPSSATPASGASRKLDESIIPFNFAESTSAVRGNIRGVDDQSHTWELLSIVGGANRLSLEAIEAAQGVPVHFVFNMDEMSHQKWADSTETAYIVPEWHGDDHISVPVSGTGKTHYCRFRNPEQ